MHRDRLFNWKPYEIEQTGESGGRCGCCGGAMRRVSGVVNHNGRTVAAYYVSWTLGRPDHGAAFDLIIGRWGKGAGSSDRQGVALDFRVVEGAPQFLVREAPDRPISGSDLFTSVLDRSQVMGTPVAAQVFALTDAAFMGDPRLDELHRW